jgi:multidrug efflux pump subunit AcrA (membrane-fusion protein)
LSENCIFRGTLRLCALGAVVVLVALAGCKRQSAGQQQGKPSEPLVVTLQPTRLADVQRTVDVVGTLYGDEEATISAKVAGRITQIYKDVGDRVALNEPLAQLYMN